MSWDADLLDDEGNTIGEWNYTHNTSAMIYAVIGSTDPHVPWWHRLSMMDGPASSAFLTKILDGLKQDPERFIQMNPENKWGSYDGLVKVLTEMVNAIPRNRSVRWDCNG